MLEHCARSGMLVIAGAINAALLCWLLNKSADLPAWSILVVAAGAAAAILVLTLNARAKAPSLSALAKLADTRAGTEDLFSSALEFNQHPDRFGWLGAQTVKKAIADASTTILRSRWTFGRLRDWWTMGSLAAALIVATLAVDWWHHRIEQEATQVATDQTFTRELVVAQNHEDAPKPVLEKPAETQAALAPLLPESETQPDIKPETTAITNAMAERHNDENNDPIDLEGVTPIRWDQEDVKNNPQDKNTEGEKIDPVKLDAALMKDLQEAKKTKDESGGDKTGGVDIAVMAKTDGTKSKDSGGKDKNSETLDGASSKDPRGEPSRMAVKPQPRPLPIRSVEKIPSRNQGEPRQMSPLDLADAMEKLKTLPPESASVAVNVTKPEDHVVRQEGVTEKTTGLTESYFDLLRKADR